MTASASLAELPLGCVPRCVACRHRGLLAEESERLKLEWLRARLAPWSGVIAPVRGVSRPLRFGYREKTCLRAEYREGRWRLGLRAVRRGAAGGRRREYDLIEIPDCPVHSPGTRALLAALAHSMPGPEAVPLAFAAVSGSLVTSVIKARSVPAALLAADTVERVWRELREAGASGWYVNLNAAAGERVFSSRGWRLMAGDARALREGRGEERWWHGPDSFQQLLPDLAAEALDEAEEFLDPRATRGDRVLDLCSGAGSSLRRWRDRGVGALGVELGGEAVDCAGLNASGMTCLRGKVSERIPQLAAWLKEGARAGEVLVYANPPRSGLEREALEWLAAVSPSRIAYLSCSAGTLARDLAVLAAARYRVQKISPYDFFPGTDHIETLALLQSGLA